MRVLCLAEARELPPVRVLREWCESNPLGNDLGTVHASILGKHTVSELRSWSDHELEREGRLTAPMRYDRDSDRYVEVGWDEAFAEIGRILKSLAPTRGRILLIGSRRARGFLSLGAHGAAVWQQQPAAVLQHVPRNDKRWAEEGDRIAGGHSDLGGSRKNRRFFFFGQNPGTNRPRFLHPLKDAKDRGARIVTFNPVREQGLISFIDPYNLYEMVTGSRLYLGPVSPAESRLGYRGNAGAVQGA